jgi:hypothetical protein
MSLFQAEKLIDLACSTTHEEEARTAALTACRLIRKLGMRLTLAGEHPPAASRRAARPAPPQPARDKPPNGGVFQRATRSTRCGNCRDPIAPGDTIYIVDEVTWCNRH